MPLLDEWMHSIFDAFLALSGARQHGFGLPQPIAISEIEMQLEVLSVPVEERDVWRRLIRAADVAYMRFHTQKKRK
jgi:hypothetical protein